MSNVISIASGLPLEVEDMLLQQIVEEEQQRVEIQAAADAGAIQTRLKVAAKLAEEGRLSGMILLGLDPVTGLFYTDVNLASVERSELFAYMGLLSTILTEIQEKASMAPTIDADGSVIDPYAEPTTA